MIIKMFLIDEDRSPVELIYGQTYFNISHSELHKDLNYKALYHQVLDIALNIKAYRNENSYKRNNYFQKRLLLQNFI